MFRWFFKHENQKETAASRKSAIRQDLATRASIANKLKNYKADEDTSISKFTLAEDVPESKRNIHSARMKSRDPWGQANPRESGKWNREDRKSRVRKSTGSPR